jgi:hypothetical protein
MPFIHVMEFIEFPLTTDASHLLIVWLLLSLLPHISWFALLHPRLSVTVLAAVAGPSLLQLHISSACRVSEAALLEALPALQRMERIDMWGCSLAGTDFMVHLQRRVGGG